MWKWLEKMRSYGESAQGSTSAAPVEAKPVQSNGLAETQAMFDHIDSSRIVGASPFQHEDPSDKEWVSIDDDSGLLTFYQCSIFNCADGPTLCFNSFTKSKPVIQGDMFGNDSVVSEWEPLSLDCKSWTVLEREVGYAYWSLMGQFMALSVDGRMAAIMEDNKPVFKKQDTVQLTLFDELESV